jgi:hypothetical protein
LSHAIQLRLCLVDIDQYNVGPFFREEVADRLAYPTSATHYYGYLAS